MKRNGRFFLWIALLAGGLLVSITIAQVVTQNSLSRLRQGTEQASVTITMNNRLQEMVNLAFELESKISTEKPALLLSPGRSLKDSLARLEYNIGVLAKAEADSTISPSHRKLTGFISKQVRLSFAILHSSENKDEALQKKLTDSLRSGHWGDSIYAYAISFQKGLEQNLNKTSEQNKVAAAQLSLLNQLLAGVALMSVLVLATIIIRRQIKQLSLIKDLEEARKVALQSAEAKDQFLANMSHEIRTPLNAIKGFGRILSQTPLGGEQQKYATIISTASENLLNIVNDILDFSKIEAGNLVLKNKAFSLAEVISEAELMFTPLASEKGLDLQCRIGAGIPVKVMGDPERLRQVLVNLMSNAVKFTNHGEVVLALECGEAVDNRVKTIITVTDTGVGIPPGKSELIFERFEQLDHSATRQQGGTGLGLAITRKLVEAMGGSIRVSSELHKGSVFTIELEFEHISTPEETTEILSAGLLPGRACLKGFRVLVAEDNKMNQLLVKTILGKHEVLSEIAENGEEVVAMAKRSGFDLVLMDVQMPKMDGITATRLLRKQSGNGIPVIAMTAHVLPGEREKCIEAGMNDYLSKPLDEEELVNMLQLYCSGKKRKKKPEKLPLQENEWINWPYLRSICGNDESGVRMVMEELRKQLPGEIASLEKGLESPSFQEIKRLCHHFRSTLSSLYSSSLPVIKLTELNELALEQAAHGKLVEKGKELLSGLRELLKSLR